MGNKSEIATTDDAKKQLKEAQDEQGIWAVLKEALANLISLEIKTEVIGGPEDEKLTTRIDLFQADRTNQIHKNFLKDPEMAPLRDFHAEQVKLAEQDLQGKLDLLERMGSAIIGAMKKGREQT